MADRGLFGNITDTMMSPLFMGGAGLLTGGGMSGMLQGMQAGTQYQDQQRQRQREDATREAVYRMPGALTMADRELLASNPQMATQVLGNAVANRLDPQAKMKLDLMRSQIAHSGVQNQVALAQLQQMKMQTPEFRAGMAGKYGLQPGTPEYNAFVLNGTYTPKEEFLKAKEGETLFRKGPNGQLEPVPMPGADGMSPAYRKEYDKTKAEARAKAELDLPRVVDNAALALKTIEQIKAHPGRSTGTGAVGLIAPSVPGSQARGFANLVDQAKGKVFLEAFNSLRGGGQITEAEGSKATQALARLDRAQSSKDFDEALADLGEVINLGMQRAQIAAGQRPTRPQDAGPRAGHVEDGYRFKGGNPSDANNWERVR